MTWPAFTAAAFLAALAHYEPAQWRHDPDRIATIAWSAERAQSELMAQWHRHPRLLGAALVTALVLESHLDERVHTGELRGASGEVCMVQIGPTNPRWAIWADSRDELAGYSTEATSACLATGLQTLVDVDRSCAAKSPRVNWLRSMWSAYMSGGCKIIRDSKERETMTNRVAWTSWVPTEAQETALIMAMVRK